MTDTTSQDAPVLQVKDLSVDFAVDKKWIPAAIDVSYEVHAGEVLAIVGESGSGKSVSSMALLGLLPKNARITGSIKLMGQEMSDMSSSKVREIRGNDIAMIFQEPMTALNPVYTIGAQIIEALRLHNMMSPTQAKDRALELLTMVELPDPVKAFNSYPHQLSGGQRQRAMIAQSLSNDPVLLIADEPTTALDVTVQAEILDLMRNLRDHLHSAVILITHDMGVVADLSDRIAVMRRGLSSRRGPRGRSSPTRSTRTPRSCSRRCRTSAPRTPSGEEIDLTAALAAATGNEDAIAVDAEELARREAANKRALEVSERARRAAEVEGTTPILQLVDVAIEYPKQGRIPAFRAVEGANLADPARRGRRSGRRVGLRQDDHRARGRRSAARGRGNARRWPASS